MYNKPVVHKSLRGEPNLTCGVCPSVCDIVSAIGPFVGPFVWNFYVWIVTNSDGLIY